MTNHLLISITEKHYREIGNHLMAKVVNRRAFWLQLIWALLGLIAICLVGCAIWEPFLGWSHIGRSENGEWIRFSGEGFGDADPVPQLLTITGGVVTFVVTMFALARREASFGPLLVISGALAIANPVLIRPGLINVFLHKHGWCDVGQLRSALTNGCSSVVAGRDYPMYTAAPLVATFLATAGFLCVLILAVAFIRGLTVGRLNIPSIALVLVPHVVVVLLVLSLR